MTSARSVLLAFAFALLVFGATHALKYPGSLAYFMEATGGQKILDMQASSSAAETYQRLDVMGPRGRDLYLRTILTVDIVFPISVGVFLLLWARFAAGRTRLGLRTRMVLCAVPIAYFTLDLLENVSVLLMLLHHPERWDFLAAAIGYLTRGKRASMLLAFAMPAVTLVVGRLMGSWRTGTLGAVSSDRGIRARSE